MGSPKRRDHLSAYHAKRKAETVKLVSAAIELLTRQKRPVSLASIRETAMPRSDGSRISESTIVRNSGAYALYLAASGKRPTQRVAATEWFLQQVPEDERASAKKSINDLRRKSKTELAQLAWERERTIADLENQLKTVRAAKLDKIVPARVKVLRPISHR